MRLKDIMSTRVESVRPDDTLERARTVMRLRNIHHLIVRDCGRVVGSLTRAALEACDAGGVERVEDAMSHHVLTAAPGMTIRCAANMLRGRADSALAVQAGAKLVGIVTVSDLLDVLGRGVDRPARPERRTLRHRGIRPVAKTGRPAARRTTKSRGKDFRPAGGSPGTRIHSGQPARRR